MAIAGALTESSAMMTLGVAVYVIVALGLIVPGLAVAARRLHDMNKSGWYYFISLIPFTGGIILLVWLFKDGDRYTNNYGPDPKNINEPEFDFEQTTITN